MKINVSGLIVAACVVAFACAGCAPSATSGPSTTERKGGGQSSDKACDWEFDYSQDGSKKIKKGSIKVTKGPCTVDETSGDLYIGEKGKEKRIRDISAAIIETDGTCRYCYINASGGMSCVVYAGC